MRVSKVASLAILLALAATLVFPTFASSTTILGTIFIRADGTVDPADAPIQQEGNTYILTGDAYARIVVQKSGITIDGAGHTIQGNPNSTLAGLWVVGQGPDQKAVENGSQVLYTIGVDDADKSVCNVTVKNLNIRDFSIGIYVWTQNDTIIDNAVTQNVVGILLSGSSNSLIGNSIERNEMGVFFGTNEPGQDSLNLVVSGNSFINNIQQFSGCQCTTNNTLENPHTWDNGKIGNYWSNYNGTDKNGDGIGDTPYVIDRLNQDRFPLMKNPTALPTENYSLGHERDLVIALTIVTVVMAISVLATVLTLKRIKKRK
jgi:parallel beta-helix repeat protein